MHEYIYIYIYIYIYVYIYTCIYIYSYIYNICKCIQLYMIYIWVNSMAKWVFSLGEATSLGEGKL